MHPGGLDANGGHVDHKTGKYHFHRPQTQPSSKPSTSTASDTPRRFSDHETISQPSARPSSLEPSAVVCLTIAALFAWCAAWLAISRLKKLKRWLRGKR